MRISPPRRPARDRVALAALLALAMSSPPVLAEDIAAGGLVFSDREGGFELLGVTGNGTLEDPFVITERITGSAPAVLVIEGVVPGFGNRARSNHFASFVVVKRVINATDDDWQSFRMELREEIDRPSDYNDGLSFGQERDPQRVFEADRYADIRIVDEPADSLLFERGLVAPGEWATFRFVVTHNAPGPTLYLVQLRETPLSLDLESGVDVWPIIR
ncbi:MAG: hypothetical protein RLO50_23590 [Azospirillaceae bacterium]